MPTCQNCKRKWSWSETVKQQLKSKYICPYCGQRQHLSEKSQFMQAVLTLVTSLAIIFVFTNIEESWVSLLVLIIISITVLLVTAPFVTELSNEKEQL
ncbi:TIGR04104 family putative zinc finger protein [Halobacillus salinus]|uniref:TIGR04104 family putative zinc finger protein n=1 Tax=Halobacillus salinus TaxID=192814 RepID=UPI0009A7D3C0|nr:TIGR04104 family putative zinc finger protein [Halobacillus salinus]